MDLDGTPESFEQDIANMIFKFKEEITIKHHLHVENEKKKVRQWKQKLQEQERKMTNEVS